MADKDVFDSPKWLNDTGDVNTSDVYMFKMYRSMGTKPTDPKEAAAYAAWLKENPAT